MENSKTVGVVLLVVALICGFVAWERWADNERNVAAMNSGLAGAFAKALNDNRPIEPAMPVVTKYALFLGAIAAAGGLFLVVKGQKSSVTPRRGDR